MTPPNIPAPTSWLGRWRRKIADSLRGIGVAVYAETSFWVHAPVACGVAALSVWLDLSAWRWAAIVLCITIVLAAEMFNSAIERLAREITQEVAPHVRDALDMASGAVLVVSLGAAIVGLLVLGPPLRAAIGW